MNDCIDEWSVLDSPLTSLDVLQNCGIHLSVVTDDCALNTLSLYINERTKSSSALVGTIVDAVVTGAQGAAFYFMGNETAYKKNIYYKIYDEVIMDFSSENLGRLAFEYVALMFSFRTDGFVQKNGTF